MTQAVRVCPLRAVHVERAGDAVPGSVAQQTLLALRPGEPVDIVPSPLA